MPKYPVSDSVFTVMCSFKDLTQQRTHDHRYFFAAYWAWPRCEQASSTQPGSQVFSLLPCFHTQHCVTLLANHRLTQTGRSRKTEAQGTVHILKSSHTWQVPGEHTLTHTGTHAPSFSRHCNSLGWGWAALLCLLAPLGKVWTTSVKFLNLFIFSFIETPSPLLLCTHLPTCVSWQRACCFPFLVSILL